MKYGNRAWTRVAGIDILAGMIVVGMLLLRLAQMPTLVSGNDPGNWLAQASQLAGVRTTAAFTIYPPLFPLVLLGAETVFRPLEAVRVAAAVVSLAPGLATYVLLRAIGLRSAALAGLAMSLAGYSSEMLAWGGYPQLLGTGLTVGTLAVLNFAFRSRRMSFLGVSGLLVGLTVLANQLSGLQVLACTAGVSLAGVFCCWSAWKDRISSTAYLVIGAAIGCLPSLPFYLPLLRHTGASAFNAEAFTGLAPLAGYVVDESPLLWAAVFATVPAAASILSRQRQWAAVATLVSLLIGSILPLVATHEVRFLHLGEVGGLLALGVVLDEIVQRELQSPFGRLVPLAAAAALTVGLCSAGLARYERAYAYYGVLDSNLATGLEWLRAHAHPGDRAASSASLRDWPFGWWVEGLARVPTYVETDPRWVAFDEEKTGVRIARSILSDSNPEAAAADARRYGVTLLVIDTRYNDRPAQWLSSGRLGNDIGVVYSNPDLTIFRVSRRASGDVGVGAKLQ